MGNEQPNNKEVPQPVTNRGRLYGVIVAAALLAVFILGRPFAALSDNSLFSPAPDSLALELDSLDNTRRARPVRINWNALDPDTEELRLNLFEDRLFSTNRLRVDRPLTGGYVWVGNIDGNLNDTVTLSVHNGVLSGSVYRAGRLWAVIEYAGQATDDVYWVREVDPVLLEPNGPDHTVPPRSSLLAPSLPSQAATCREDGSVIDLMIAYTPQAREAIGGQEAMIGLITQRISEMNTTNDLSGAAFDWRLVNVMEVDYVESGDILTDLKNLHDNGDGIMDGVHFVRDQHKADLVGLLISEGRNNACGYAYLMEEISPGFAPHAFGVTALDYAEPYSCSDLTLAHEFGHNMGNAHDRNNAHQSGPFNYSYGHQSPNSTFRTIMAYDCPGGCPRINQWSNPDIWFEGERTGVAEEVDPANASNVVLSMHQARVEVANFRANCVEPTVTPTNTPVDMPSATETATPTQTPTETPTETPLPVNTNTPTPTNTPTLPPEPPTQTPRPTRTPRVTPTAEPSTTPGNALFLPMVIRNR